MKKVSCLLLLATAVAGSWCRQKGWSYCRTSRQCGHGEGDCDGNSECKKGLTCVSSNGGHISGWAVDCCRCPTKVKTWDFCNSNCKCSHGQGDCDSNGECRSGMSCRSSVPGQVLGGSAMDYCCYNIDGWHACDNKNCKCGFGQGDCDSDSHCHAPFKCRSSDPKQQLSGSSKDYCCPASDGVGSRCSKTCQCKTGLDCKNGKCAKPPTKAPTKMPTKTPTKTPTKMPTKTPTKAPTKAPTTCRQARGKNGDWSFCHATCRCGHNEGDCDANSQCKPGLQCYSQISTQTIHGSAKDYCMKPLALKSHVTSCQYGRGQNLEYLDRQNVDSGSGNLMRGFRLIGGSCTGNNMQTRVDSVTGIAGSCSTSYTSCQVARHRKLEYLDRQNVECTGNTALQRWQLTGGGCSSPHMRTLKKCCKVGAQWKLGTCSVRYTACQVSRGQKLEFWDRQNVVCKSNEVLTRFQLMNSGCSGNKQKVVYRCCSLVPVGALAMIADDAPVDDIEDEVLQIVSADPTAQQLAEAGSAPTLSSQYSKVLPYVPEDEDTDEAAEQDQTNDATQPDAFEDEQQDHADVEPVEAEPAQAEPVQEDTEGFDAEPVQQQEDAEGVNFEAEPDQIEDAADVE